MSNKQPELKLAKINANFFGKEKTNRYLLDVFKECIEKLIITNVLIEVWAGTKRHHEHTQGKNCNFCLVFYQIYYSCIDSLFLHIRLLFSGKEPLLATAFLDSLTDLSIKDFEDYYRKEYDYTLKEADKSLIQELLLSVQATKDSLSKLYLKRVEPYQSFAFHQPVDGIYYSVKTTTEGREGVKVVTHTKNSKFRRDLRSAKEMLDLLSDIIHPYLKVSSTYYHTLKLDPKSYVFEICNLLGVEMEKKSLDNAITNATIHTEKMIHILECSGGLKSHNGLVFKKIETAFNKNTC